MNYFPMYSHLQLGRWQRPQRLSSVSSLLSSFMWKLFRCCISVTVFLSPSLTAYSAV